MFKVAGCSRLQYSSVAGEDVSKILHWKVDAFVILRDGSLKVACTMYDSTMHDGEKHVAYGYEGDVHVLCNRVLRTDTPYMYPSS